MTPADLRASLKALGMTQRRLALNLDYTESQISRYATGREPIPTHIAAYLDAELRAQRYLEAIGRASSNVGF